MRSLLRFHCASTSSALKDKNYLLMASSSPSSSSSCPAVVAALLASTSRRCSTTKQQSAAAGDSGDKRNDGATDEREGKGSVEYITRRKTTDREIYEPGAIAKALRAAVVAVSTTFGLQQRIARRMERGLKEVERLEKEQKWLRRHGSPLRVLGLPETADLEDVKVRYRNLLFEVHPDTAPQKDQKAMIAAGLTPENARQRQMEEFELLKAAYQIATSPNSLWHQDGNAPGLLRELEPEKSGLVSRIVTPHNLFPVAAYLYGLAVAVFFCSFVAYYFLMATLEAVDPDFFKFMMRQEEEERRKKEAGEVVDTDPKRLAPKKMMRISAPGKFVHGAASGGVPDEDQFEDLK